MSAKLILIFTLSLKPFICTYLRESIHRACRTGHLRMQWGVYWIFMLGAFDNIWELKHQRRLRQWFANSPKWVLRMYDMGVPNPHLYQTKAQKTNVVHGMSTEQISGYQNFTWHYLKTNMFYSSPQWPERIAEKNDHVFFF